MPGIAIGYALRGELLTSKLGRHSDSIQAFSDAIVINPQRSVFYTGRGLAYYNLKRLPLALSDFETATKVDPTDASARYNTACVLALLGRNREAVLALASAINLDDRLLSQAETDKDLASIRDLPEFAAIKENSTSVGRTAH